MPTDEIVGTRKKAYKEKKLCHDSLESWEVRSVNRLLLLPLVLLGVPGAGPYGELTAP